MSESSESTNPVAEPGAEQPRKAAARKRGGGLNSLLLADLKAMAVGLGISGAKGMKKAQLIEAIKSVQSGAQQSGDRDKAEQVEQSQPVEKPQQAERPQKSEQQDHKPAKSEQSEPKQSEPKQGRQRGQQQSQQHGRQDKQNQDKQQDRQQQGQQDKNQQNQQNQQGEEGTGRNRRRRGRDRSERGRNRNEPDTTILEDDVLVPAAGILDVLDNYAFVRTSGYLPGAEDVYVSLSMVRKFGMRRGDAIVGQVRQPREGERKEKFNPMVRIDAVNGADPETARSRPAFDEMTPLFPTERLRLETEPTNLIGRVIDIAAPLGKGQRGLIVSPARAGKTTVLSSIANSISINNPECHLMVVLVDERPEEVTDYERSVKGEVISSTFDRPAADHTAVAELAIERAKRLVELGHDVVVLLDGITRLGRAYNLSTSASGRVLPGGVDAASLHPPKRFFGAARNIEDGGSLTILATAQVESGSPTDEAIFQEFEGTENLALRLRGEFAEKRIFPAIDVVRSVTRREERLVGEEESAILAGLRRDLAGLGDQQALESLLERLGATQTNIEFLMKVQQAARS